MPEPLQGRGSPARHAVPLAFFGLLSFLFTWPLARHLTDGVLGAGAGDNLSALWNIWWARTALSGPASLFWTDALFAPFGSGLVLHSFAPLESAAAGVLAGPDPVTAYNVALIVAVFLNLACAYWAAWTLTGQFLPSCVAALAFGGAPFLLVRLQGHLNVLNAWGLPLLLIATRRCARVSGVGSSLLMAITIAVLAYTDPYFAIFGVVLALAYLALNRWPFTAQVLPPSARRRTALMVLLPAMVLVVAVIGWIEATGGTDTSMAGIRLRMTDSFNPRVILGFLIAAACLAWKWPGIQLVPPPHSPNISRLAAVVLAATALMCAPLFIAALHLWRAGDYESQVYFWRSAPPGIDVGALLSGNPIGLLTGSWTQALYERLDIDRVESAVWLGAAPIALTAIGFARLRAHVEARKLLLIAGLFFVWSLGPYLRIFGFNTAFMLPQTLLRFVPIVANARIPGRAFVVVILMVALLAAIALATIADRRRRMLTAVAALVILTVEFWPAPHAVTAADRPALYAVLREQPPGTVLEVPLGWRDGFGHRGDLDHRVLLYQTLHEHPLMGGFVARLSGRIKRAYDADPVLGPILDLSEGRSPAPSLSTGVGAPPPRRASADAAPPGASLPQALPLPACRLTCEVRYVVVDEERASSDLRAFAAKAFSLRLLERSASRALYVVE